MPKMEPMVNRQVLVLGLQWISSFSICAIIVYQNTNLAFSLCISLEVVD